jgi:AMP nucleosidase
MNVTAIGHPALAQHDFHVIERTKEVHRAMELLEEIYRREIEKVTTSINQSAHLPGSQSLYKGHYPFVALEIQGWQAKVDKGAAFGYCRQGPGLYLTTVTRPQLFKSYLLDQLTLLQQAHDVEFLIGVSAEEIPVEFAVSPDQVGLEVAGLLEGRFAEGIANSGRYNRHLYPLSLFSASQQDERLERFAYYTGTQPEDLQPFVLLTNYQMYVEGFVAWAQEVTQTCNDYTDLVMPKALRDQQEFLRLFHMWVEETQKGVSCPIIDIPQHLIENYAGTKGVPQMPAYHLKRKDGKGISLINIGVGPSNAATIIEVLAPLRPFGIIMVGHCGGLRGDIQEIGDYILADGYFRDDGIYPEIIGHDVPILPIAELTRALRQAMRQELNLDEHGLRQRLQTGTVATTNFRLWEIDTCSSWRDKIINSHALAVDMESATVAAACVRYRIPHGTLLVVSDLPLHGKPKSQSRAQQFYKQATDAHLKVAVRACEILQETPLLLQSRKLRTAKDAPFR